MEIIKKWWLLATGAIILILDFGFDAISPLITEIGIPDKWFKIIQLIFGLYGIWKLKQSNPIMLNKEDDGPGKVVPPTGP